MTATTDSAAPDDGDVVPVHRIAGARGAGLVLICDHATNALPAGCEGLGLPPERLSEHIAYDIGAAALTRALAARFSAPAVLCGFSRLWADPNRPEDDPAVIPERTGGVTVPGNTGLSASQRAARLDQSWRPYHDAVGALMDRLTPAGLAVSVHTFTPAMDGQARPWPKGVLWNHDEATARRAIAALGRVGLDGPVGDNEPYDGRAFNHTMDRHAAARGLAHVTFEVRQDLVTDAAGVAVAAEALGAAIAELIAP